MSYADRATQYAEDVVSGKVLASKLTIGACRRHLEDLKAAEADDYPYLYNPLMIDLAGVQYYPVERVCHFIELLPHVKGRQWVGQKIKLEDWQCFLLGSAFGWIERETGLRRFKTVYCEVPRKNAKTTIAAGVALYLLVRDDEHGAEVYSAATSADQAQISWGIAKSMVEACPGMRKRFGVSTHYNSIAVASTGSFFKYLSSDHKTLEGKNMSGGIIDELHAHRTREVYDVVENATGAREQSMLFIITTAGSDQSGVCYEQRTYVVKLVSEDPEKRIIDDTYFGLIYTIDKDDDWTDPAIWAKANPNLGVSCRFKDLERLCDKAKTLATAQNTYLTKRLNVWVNADVAWMSMPSWNDCADPDLRIEDFAGGVMWAGMDLASKKDIASTVNVFKKLIDGETHYYAFGRCYLPINRIKMAPNDSYAGWVKDGYLIATPGSSIDHRRIEDDIVADSVEYIIDQAAYDPAHATQIVSNLLEQDIQMIEVRPSVLNFSEPMKELEAAVLDGRFHHDGNPCHTWQISNVVCHTDKKDNIYPNKERPENKIDYVVALIMAIGRAITGETKSPSVYETRGVIRL